MKQKKKVNVSKLIKRFTDMKERGTLLSGPNVTSDDILSQIIGTIVKESMVENDNDELSVFDTGFKFKDISELETKPMHPMLKEHLEREYVERLKRTMVDNNTDMDVVDDVLKHRSKISDEYILVRVTVNEVNFNSFSDSIHRIRFDTGSKKGRRYGEIEYDVNKAFNKLEDYVSSPTAYIYI